MWERYTIGSSGLIFLMSGISPGIWGSSVICQLRDWLGQAKNKRRTNKSDINTTRSQWTTFGRPTQTVLEDPSIKTVPRFLRQTKIGRCDALQNVVVVFGGTENSWRRVGNIPARKR
jgi:hypothetical protein